MKNLAAQSGLFATPKPDGLSYILDFIDAESEQKLIACIDVMPWRNELKRRVQHYGYAYDYKARSVTPESYLGPIPEWLKVYGEKLHALGHFKALPDQVIVNEYQPGQGISAHIDCVPCFDCAIASLSLGSPCVMDFSRDGEQSSLLLSPRSLLVLSEEGRYKWKHAIAARKSDR
jgi:alkylated DNA repair dioxygenase AlkB